MRVWGGDVGAAPETPVLIIRVWIMAKCNLGHGPGRAKCFAGFLILLFVEIFRDLPKSFHAQYRGDLGFLGGYAIAALSSHEGDRFFTTYRMKNSDGSCGLRRFRSVFMAPTWVTPSDVLLRLSLRRLQTRLFPKTMELSP
mmetsp:Transcript_42782/g.63459  ORF Transcript_42782/g.63459 Transcript_42782/m.63459 type:complete len:141 (+) Transcript_42782:122-544(+)